MKKTLTMLAVAGLTAAIATAPAGAAKPTTPKVPSAAKQCKTEKAAMGAATFAQTYGTNARRANAMGKCVSQRNAATKAARKAAKGDAAKTAKTVKSQVAGDIGAAKLCKAEKQAGAAAFAAKYGTNANHRNAFGKCVSAQAKQQSGDAAKS